MQKKPSILIIDDDEKWLYTIKGILGNDYNYTTSTKGEEALELFKTDMFSLVIIDKQLPDLSGVEVLREMALINPNLGAIILTGHADFESAVESMKIGALDYVSKGENNLSEKLKVMVSKSLKKVLEKEERARELLFADVIGEGCQNSLHRKIIEEFFKKKEWLAVEPVNWTEEGASRYAYLIKTTTAGNKRGSPFFVKICKPWEIEKESQRHTQVFNKGVLTPRLVKESKKYCECTYVCTDDKCQTKIKGILYDFAGSGEVEEVKSLDHLIEHGTEQQLEKALIQLFQRSLKNIYTHELGLSPPRKIKELRYLGFHKKKFDLLRSKLEISSGILDINNLDAEHFINFSYSLLNLNKKIEVIFSKIHGDLHPRNIIVDRNNVWVVDFANYGDGHLFKDFTRLEAEIRGLYIRYTKNESLKMLDIENDAIKNNDFFFNDINIDTIENENIRKSILAAQIIRKYLSEVLDREGYRLNNNEYFFSLLGNTLVLPTRESISDVCCNFSIQLCALLVDKVKIFMSET